MTKSAILSNQGPSKETTGEVARNAFPNKLAFLKKQ